MKYVLPVLLLAFVATTAQAQDAPQKFPERYYQLNRPTPLYKKSDTLSVHQRVPASEKLLVIGREPGLALVKRSGFQYYVPVRFLLGLNAAHLAMQTDPAKGTYFYSEVVSVNDATKAELYRRAKKWVATAYRSAQDVIQLDDPEGGELLMKGNVDVGVNNSRVRHLLTISVKDGKYRYDVRDFVIISTANFGDIPLEKPGYGYRKKFIDRNDEEINTLLSSLKEAMNPPAGPAKGDW